MREEAQWEWPFGVNVYAVAVVTKQMSIFYANRHTIREREIRIIICCMSIAACWYMLQLLFVKYENFA